MGRRAAQAGGLVPHAAGVQQGELRMGGGGRGRSVLQHVAGGLLKGPVHQSPWDSLQAER